MVLFFQGNLKMGLLAESESQLLYFSWREMSLLQQLQPSKKVVEQLQCKKKEIRV